MEKEKTFKLVKKWYQTRPYKVYSGDSFFVKEFIDWLYKKGYTIETKFQGEDLKKQEELYDSKK